MMRLESVGPQESLIMGTEIELRGMGRAGRGKWKP